MGGAKAISGAPLKARGFFRAPGCITGTVGMRARSCQLTRIDNEIFLPDGAPLEPALQNFPHARRIARLRGECGACRMWRHAMMRHGPPRMVFRRRLREPDISCIAGKFPALQRSNNGVPVANLAARGIYDIGTALH